MGSGRDKHDAKCVLLNIKKYYSLVWKTSWISHSVFLQETEDGVIYKWNNVLILKLWTFSYLCENVFNNGEFICYTERDICSDIAMLELS